MNTPEDTRTQTMKRKPPKLWLVLFKTGRQVQCQAFTNRKTAEKTMKTMQLYHTDWEPSLLETACDWQDITPTGEA